MANHKSAIKAHQQSLKRRDHNRQLRTQLRHALKAVRSAIDGGDTSQARVVLRTTTSLIDKLVHKGILHTNAASRYKSRLTKRLQTSA